MKSDVFQTDDGISPKNLNIETIRQALRQLREDFKMCVEGGRTRQLCYAALVNSLIDAFGSLLPYVIHDAECRFYILKGTEGKLLVYDADEDAYRIVELPEAVRVLLSAKQSI